MHNARCYSCNWFLILDSLPDLRKASQKHMEQVPVAGPVVILTYKAREGWTTEILAAKE